MKLQLRVVENHLSGGSPRLLVIHNYIRCWLCRLCCGYLCRLHNWNGDCLSFWYSEYVFTSYCGLWCFWKLKCGDLLTFADLFLAFFGLILYFTEKLHCLIPEGQKVSPHQVFNLRLEIVAEQLSWTWDPDMHPEMWKSSTSSSRTDLKLDLQQWW